MIARPAEWPGRNVAEALVTGEPIKGVWFDRTAEYDARRRGGSFEHYTYATRLRVEIDVLPCWRDLPVEAARALASEMIQRIEDETAAMHRKQGSRPAGPDRVCKSDPRQRPNTLSSSPAPLFHVAARVVRSELYSDYIDFVTAFRRAADRLRQGMRDVVFPYCQRRSESAAFRLRRRVSRTRPARSRCVPLRGLCVPLRGLGKNGG